MNMKEIDIDFVKSKISEVLKKAHSDPRRQNIKDFPDRLNFCCPCCGDSSSDANKKRANIYKDNPTYLVCFNNDCRSSITKLMNDFNIDITLEEKQAIYDYADSHIKFEKKDVYIPEHLNKLIDLDELSNYLNDHPEYQISKFKSIQTNSAAYQYLKFDRLIDNFENIYECDYHLTPKWTEKCIVMLNKSGKKLLGMQIRNMKPGDKRFFKIFNFEKIYTILHPDENVDELEMLSYNKLSNFYNILNVNWDDPVTIFEGMLDSLFMNYDNRNNSIGAIGLNSLDTDLSFLFDADLNIQFFLDQDRVGIKKSQILLNDGYKVFLWQKLIDDLLKKQIDKYVAKKYYLKIKDLNKLAQEINNMEKFKKLNLQKYFSNDIFDSLYLDETLYPKPNYFGKKQYDKNKYKK